MSKSYVLICKETRAIKRIEETKSLCIFDTFEHAKSIADTFISSAPVSIVECEMTFANQSLKK